MRSVKEEWIGRQMRQRQREFTEFTQLKYFAGTWNVNGRPPTADLDLTPWLLSADAAHNLQQTLEEIPDIFFIGLQEMDLSAEALLRNESNKDSDWLRAVEAVLRPRGYVKLISKQMVGLLLMIYLRESLFPEVSQVSVDSAGCGMFFCAEYFKIIF
jgi:hypothetical protein